MKKLIRVISLVLCVALMISLISISVVAKGGETSSVVIKTDKSSALPGDEITVTVNVANNYNALAMRWLVLYSSDVFELGDYSGNFSSTSALDVLGGSSMSNMEGLNVVYPDGYSADDYSAAVIQWLGNGEQVAVFNSPEGTDCFTFTLKVKETAELGAEGEIFIPSSWDKFYDLALEDVNDVTSYYKATDMVYTFTDAEVRIGEEETPELLAVDGSDTVIDKDNSTIYGFTYGISSESDIADYVYATGGAEVEFISTANGCGTGSIVNLVKDDEVLESYDVIIFGDLDGSGYTDESDWVVLDMYISYLYEISEDSAQYQVADATGDGFIDETDIMYYDMVLAYIGEFNQVTGELISY